VSRLPRARCRAVCTVRAAAAARTQLCVAAGAKHDGWCLARRVCGRAEELSHGVGQRCAELPKACEQAALLARKKLSWCGFWVCAAGTKGSTPVQSASRAWDFFAAEGNTQNLRQFVCHQMKALTLSSVNASAGAVRQALNVSVPGS